MKIFVHAKPNAREDKIEKIDAMHYAVAVTALPVKGAANRAVAHLLAEHFGVAPSRVRLVSGFSSRQKIFEIFF